MDNNMIFRLIAGVSTGILLFVLGYNFGRKRTIVDFAMALMEKEAEENEQTRA